MTLWLFRQCLFKESCVWWYETCTVSCVHSNTCSFILLLLETEKNHTFNDNNDNIVVVLVVLTHRIHAEHA